MLRGKVSRGRGLEDTAVQGSGCIPLAANSQAYTWYREVGISWRRHIQMKKRTAQAQGEKVSVFLGMYASSLAQ